MSGCERYPIDLSYGGLCCVQGSSEAVPINVDAPRQISNVRMKVNFIDTQAMTENIFKSLVVPYLNRVYLQAGVNLYVSGVSHAKEVRHCNRSAPPGYPAERYFCRRLLTDMTSHINVFVVRDTLMGALGYCWQLRDSYPDGDITGENYIVIGERQEGRWLSLGSFANVLAHEIGHAFGLDHHPDRNHLMYWEGHTHEPEPGQGELLDQAEIDQIRTTVEIGFTTWNFADRDPPSNDVMINLI